MYMYIIYYCIRNVKIKAILALKIPTHLHMSQASFLLSLTFVCSVEFPPVLLMCTMCNYGSTNRVNILNYVIVLLAFMFIMGSLCLSLSITYGLFDEVLYDFICLSSVCICFNSLRQWPSCCWSCWWVVRKPYMMNTTISNVHTYKHL